MDRSLSPMTLFVFIVVVVTLKSSEGKNGTINWKSCGGEGFIMTDITFSPNPFTIPSYVKNSARINITTRLNNLSANMTYEKKNGSMYEYFPFDCKYGGILIDSCGTDDLCTEWAKGDCPPNIKAINANCTCPLEAGIYELLPYMMDISDVLEVGQYRLKEEMIMNGKVVGCIESVSTITE